MVDPRYHFGRGALIAGLVLFTLGVLQLVMVHNDAIDLEEHGIATDGVVRRVEHGKANRVTVSYDVGRRSFEHTVDVSVSSDHHPGDRVTAYYDPRDPNDMTIPGGTNQNLPAKLLMAALLGLGLAFLLAWGGQAIGRRRDARRLRAQTPH